MQECKIPYPENPLKNQVNTASQAAASRTNRQSINILVSDASAIGMIGVIRSLGRAGYRVHAASSNPRALGFNSSYTFASVQHPPYKDVGYIDWLMDYIEKNAIQAIVPSEGFLHASNDNYETLRHLLPDSVDKPIWQRCLSKIETFEKLVENPQTSSHLPACQLIRGKGDIRELDDVESMPGPFYIKGDAGKALPPNKSAIVQRCESFASLEEHLEILSSRYSELMFQQYVSGKKVGVSLWRHCGEFRAENMALGIHMMPWQGGMMTLRRTFWNDRILEDAKRKLEALDWQGIAMMEYKWDPVSDEFWFIEINARYWGYLHLDIYVGKDFPLLQMDAFFGDVRADMGPPKVNSVCRYSFPGEVSYLFSRLKSNELDLMKKAGSVVGFFLRFLHPFIKADLWFPADRTLYWRALWRWFRDIGKARRK